MPNHIGYQGYNDPVQYMTELVNSGYSVIMLTRRNLFHIAISLVYAQMSGKYHYKYSERTQKLPKLSIEPKKVIEKIDWIKRLSELQKEIVKSLPHIEFVYEDHLLPATEHQATVDRIVDYLGIPRAPVTTNLSRTGIDRIIDSIANFKEIDEILRQRYASQYLAEINY
jgi:hypothetical protein